jgi:glutamine amidotransferase
MCRLFGMNAGPNEVHVTYWLLDAPDSILAESHRNPDGTGIGWFTGSGAPHVAKQPESAFDDPMFTQEAAAIDACTLITHIRAATAGQEALQNTHPFVMDGLIVAHNGGFGDLAAVDAELGDWAHKVEGDTDSERYAALIAKHTAALGDPGAGLAAAANWLADSVPLYSLNALVIAHGNLWALRYPDQRALHVARRRLEPRTGGVWSGASDTASHTVVTHHPTDVVLVASERIDGSDDWRMLDPGELLHVGPDLQGSSRVAVDHPPAHLHLLDEADPNIDDV